MSSAHRNQEREHLEHLVQEEGHENLLRGLQRKHRVFKQFGGWKDVVLFMREGTSRDQAKDEILLPIFYAMGESADRRWREILLLIFWPGLENLHKQKEDWDSDEEDRWQNILWNFIRALYRVDVHDRPEHIVQQIINLTFHLTFRQYIKAWRRQEGETITGPARLEALAGSIPDIDFNSIELHEVQESKLKRLQSHLSSGHISKSDFLLLVGTRVYGKTVAQYAKDIGLGYHAAKKRRQRAEARIRDFEEIGRSLSP